MNIKRFWSTMQNKIGGFLINFLLNIRVCKGERAFFLSFEKKQ